MGKGKGGKGKDEWKGKGGKGRYDRYFKGDGRGPQVSPFAAGVAAPLLAVPQFADGSWGKELSGGLHAFDRGHILFSTKELYFEVLGQCSVHLAVPAPTKIDGRDRQEFANSGPVELAGRSFRNLQELRSEIVTLRKAHSNPPRRLEPEAERLMRSVFEHHPQATEKLKDLQFIQVASNPQSKDPTDVTFFVMRNEQDGDDISYVKCLRAMVTKEGEQMLPLATLSRDHGLNLRVASGNVQIGPSSQGFGVKVDLERLALSVLLTEGLRGPWQLELGRQHSDLPHVPLRVVVEVAEGEAAVIRWAAPFDFAQPRPPKPPTPPGQELALPALEDQFRSEELKRSLEAMMKDQSIPGDLSSLSVEELQRIAMQIVVKSLGASLRVTRSASACAVQNQSLLRIAREQGMELTCQQLQDARTELQKVKGERYTAEATLNQLREEMAVLRRKVTQVEGEREAPVVPDAPRRAPQAAGCAVAATELEELRRKLQAELPELAGSMLRNSLKLMSSELYSGPSRALWELLQNADDCSYDQEAEMQIEQTGNYLWIEYNEQGFSWEDVEALCSLGSSTKGIAQTGEKGVGFKSAFVLSSRPHILSNPYRFFFDETASCPLPHVTPQRILADATLPRRPPERGTAVYLPLRKDFPELLNEIVPESLLFLRRLHHVTVGRQSFSLHHQNGCSTLLVADSSGTKEHHYIIARAQELAIAFPLAGGGPAALLSATLPIHWLEGLKTPLNAPFELTANREALRENSQRNVELRDALAELFLQAAAEHKILSSRVWQLQPDAEGGGFWAPFVQRVRAGLQEVPLIPVIPDAGQKNRWALKRCRNPSSELLRDLNLLPSDLEKVGLAIPTEEFLRQLPEGSEFNLPEFDAKDLLGLLQCGDISTTWRSYGNEWRQRVVGALERRLSEVDLALRATLRSLALFPTGADDWSSCDDQIYLSLPEGAPEGLLKALHSSRACAADRALLTALGGGGVATARDVAYAVLQRGLGLADVEDRRFSWTNLAYLGHHWQSILQCGAADEWLAKQTPEQMEELLRSVALPSCSGRLLHCASELRCPFLLGCKSSAADRSNLLAEPPGANDIQARLRWELVFLRLGAQVAEDQGLQLPRNFFAEGVGKELGPLLDHYEQLGVLQTISKKCCIPDRTGCICQAGHLLGPAFQPLLGPDGIVDLADDCAEEAVRLLGVVVTPTALLVAQMLKRAAQGGTETLRRSYEFLSAEWREGRVDEESLLTLKNGMWMLNCEGDLSFEQVADVTWEDVQRQISLWPKDGLHGIFRAMGVSPSTGAEAATPPEASQPANGQNRSGERPPAKSSSQPLTWPALPQVRSMAEDGGGAFREPSGAQLPLLGKLLQQIFYSAGGDDMLYGRLGKETREMLASDIHFTHNSISRRFGHGELKGRQVEDVAKALREGNMTTKELPLVVVKFESNYYTLNNRSLYALRKASRAQKPLRAQVAAFETMCPVTAKFIQLRCSSLAGQDESLAQRATNSSDEEA